MTIREALPEDVPRIVEMGRRQMTVLFPGWVDNPAQLAALTTQLLESPTGIVFVSEDHLGVNGMIGLVLFPHHLTGEKTAGEIAWWVEPEARGAGVALLKRAERWAAERGAVQVQMQAPNLRVGKLYERRGYRMAETAYYRPVTPALTALRVIDHVLLDPAAYRTAALAHAFGDVETSPGVVFHGMSLGESVIPEWIQTRYPSLTPTLTFLRKSPEGQAEPNYIHTDRDMGEWTGIFYLTADPPAEDGTTFWRDKETGQIASTAETEDEFLAEWLAWRDPSRWEAWETVPAKPNRLVLFPAPYFHSRAIPDNYGQGEDARLIQVVFGTGSFAPEGWA